MDRYEWKNEARFQPRCFPRLSNISLFFPPDYDLSKLRDFMDQQVDTYIDKGILEKDEGEVIKRIYGSL